MRIIFKKLLFLIFPNVFSFCCTQDNGQLMRWLQQENFDITAAKNGVEVMKKLEGESFDVILMDINMPKMDGMECARQIRALENADKSATPIFAITGNANNYSDQEFKEAGINEYLPKPLDFDNLVTLVHNYTS